MESRSERTRINVISWERYGFTRLNQHKKYMAQCNHCKKALANSSTARMIKHRKVCDIHRQDFTAELHNSGISSRTTANKSVNDIKSVIAFEEVTLSNDDIDKLLKEDAINPDIECLDDHLLPSYSFKLNQELRKTHIKAETEYLRIKAQYFKKMYECAKLKRTLMLLEAKKMQLEIYKCENIRHA